MDLLAGLVVDLAGIREAVALHGTGGEPSGTFPLIPILSVFALFRGCFRGR